MVVAYHYYKGHVKSNTNYMKLSHKVMIIIALWLWLTIIITAMLNLIQTI